MMINGLMLRAHWILYKLFSHYKIIIIANNTEIHWYIENEETKKKFFRVKFNYHDYYFLILQILSHPSLPSLKNITIFLTKKNLNRPINWWIKRLIEPRKKEEILIFKHSNNNITVYQLPR